MHKISFEFEKLSFKCFSFVPLRNPAFFEKVYADGISIAWNDTLDFCPETLYEEGVDCN